MGNFIIDALIIVICNYTLTIIIYNFYPEILHDNPSALNIAFGATIFCYYFFLELILGRTIGKIITNTTVVDRNGNKPNPFRLLIRTLARLIPFDGFTYLFGSTGLHDLLSRTTVIKRVKPI